MKRFMGINTIDSGEDFEYKENRRLRRERFKEELKKEFSEIFDTE